MPPPLADQFEQPPPGMLIVLMCPQVISQLIDARGQQCDLHFWRPGIPLVTTKILDKTLFFSFA
jgi:hypothetical protein